MCVCTNTFKKTVYTHLSLCLQVIAAAHTIIVTAHTNKNIREKSFKTNVAIWFNMIENYNKRYNSCRPTRKYLHTALECNCIVIFMYSLISLPDGGTAEVEKCSR